MAETDDGLMAQDRKAALELLRWYVEMGADEAIGEEPVDRFAPTPAPPNAVASRNPQRAVTPAISPSSPNALEPPAASTASGGGGTAHRICRVGGGGGAIGAGIGGARRQLGGAGSSDRRISKAAR